MENDDNRQYINDIYIKTWKYHDIDQANTQRKLLETISSDIYPDPKRFILEIIQN